MASEYEAKIIELQVYLPALEKRITDARNRKDSLVSGRLEKLHDIVSKKRKVPMGILLKTEEAIKKFIKDVSVVNNHVSKDTNAPYVNSSPENVADECKKSASTSNTMVVKEEVIIATATTANSVDTDDNDDVEFVASSNSDTIILLDSDSSDDEREKQSEKNIAQIQTKIKCEQLAAHEMPSPISKEIVKVKDIEENGDKNSTFPNSPEDASCCTIKTEAEPGEVLLVINVIPRCDDVVCIDDDDDEQDTCDVSTEKSDELSKTLPQVEFDPNNVVKSRGILHEIESQLKQLTNAPTLSLSLDSLQKEDSIDKFLAKSSEVTATKEQELLEAEILGRKDKEEESAEGKDRNCDKRENCVSSTGNTLPFPLLHFGMPLIGLETISSGNEQRDRSQSDGKADQNDTTKASDWPQNSRDEDTLKIEQNKISAIANKRQSLDISNAETSSTLPSEYTLSSDYPAEVVSEADQEVMSEAELTMKANNRLADIIASLRRNLKHKESTSEVEKSKEKLAEIFVNKMQLTEIPSLVQDMLSESFVRQDSPVDDGDGRRLIIDDSIANKDLCDQLLGDLDNSVNLFHDVSELPLGSLHQGDVEEEDSLDREISQAIAEDTMKSPGLVDFDLSELPEELDLIDDGGENELEKKIQENDKMQSKDEDTQKTDSVKKVKIMEVGDSEDLSISVDPAIKGVHQIGTDILTEEIHPKEVGPSVSIPPKFESSKEIDRLKLLEIRTCNESPIKSSSSVKKRQEAEKQAVDVKISLAASDDNEKLAIIQKNSITKEGILLSSSNVERENHLPESNNFQKCPEKDKCDTEEENNSAISLLESTPELVINTSSDVTFDEKDVNAKFMHVEGEEICKENSEIVPYSKRLKENCNEASASSITVEMSGQDKKTVSSVGEKDSLGIKVTVIPDKGENCTTTESLNIKKVVNENKCVGSNSGLKTDSQVGTVSDKTSDINETQKKIAEESTEKECIQSTQFKTIKTPDKTTIITKTIPPTEEREDLSTTQNLLNLKTNAEDILIPSKNEVPKNLADNKCPDTVDKDVIVKSIPPKNQELENMEITEETEHVNNQENHANLKPDTDEILNADKSISKSLNSSDQEASSVKAGSKNIIPETTSTNSTHKSDAQKVELMNEENTNMSPQETKKIEDSDATEHAHSTPKHSYRKIELDEVLTPDKYDGGNKSPEFSGQKASDLEATECLETAVPGESVVLQNKNALDSADTLTHGQESENKEVTEENSPQSVSCLKQDINALPKLSTQETSCNETTTENTCVSSQKLHLPADEMKDNASVSESLPYSEQELERVKTTPEKYENGIEISQPIGQDVLDINTKKAITTPTPDLKSEMQVENTISNKILKPSDQGSGDIGSTDQFTTHSNVKSSNTIAASNENKNMRLIGSPTINEKSAIDPNMKFGSGTPRNDDNNEIINFPDSESITNTDNDNDSQGTPLFDEREAVPINVILGTPLRDECEETEIENIPNMPDMESAAIDNSAAIESSNMGQGTPVRDESNGPLTLRSDALDSTPTRDETQVSTKCLQAVATQLSAFSEISQINNKGSARIFQKIISGSPESITRKANEMQMEEVSNSSTNMEGESKEANLAALMQAEYHDRLRHIMTPLDASQDAREYQSRTLETSTPETKSVRVVASFSKAIKTAVCQRNAKVAASTSNKSSDSNKKDTQTTSSEKKAITDSVENKLLETTNPTESENSINADVGKDEPSSSSIHSNTSQEKVSEKVNESESKDSKEAERVVATFSAQSTDLKDLLRRRKELENKLSTNSEDNVERSQTTSSTIKTTKESENLSEISLSEDDCVSLSLSDISDPESGELIEKPPMPRPKVKIESSHEVPVSRRLSSKDLNKPDLCPLKITIQNKTEDEFDLRAVLLSRSRRDAGDELLEGEIRRRKRKKKKKCKRKNRSARNKESGYLPTMIESNYESHEMHENDNTDTYSDSCSSDLPEFDPVRVKHEPPERSRHRLKGHASTSDVAHAYIKSEVDDTEFPADLKGTWNRKIKMEMVDDKLEMQRELRARLAALDEEINSQLRLSRQNSGTPTSERYFKTDSISPRRHSDSAESDRKSSIILLKSPRHSIRSPRSSRSPRRTHRSPIKLSKSPIRSIAHEKRRAILARRSRSPSRRSKSPNQRRRLSRSPIRRRLSRSPIHRGRSPISRISPNRRSRSPRFRARSPKRLSIGLNRRSRSPRRRSRSPRWRSRSPRRRSRSLRRRSKSPRRRSRSPRRRSRSAKRRSRSPRRYSKSPKRRSISPLRRLSRSPKKEAESPIRTSTLLQAAEKTLFDTKAEFATKTDESNERSKLSPNSLSKSSKNEENSPNKSLPLELESIPLPPENDNSKKENSQVICAVIDLSDSDDDIKPSPKEDTNKDNKDPVDDCFTIEVSDEEDFIEAPPPPIISCEVKSEESAQQVKEQTSNNESSNIILVDDDYNDAFAEVESGRQIDTVSAAHNSTPIVNGTVTNTKLEPFFSKAEMSDNLQNPLTDDFGSNENDLPSPEDNEPPTGSVEALKEKDLNELHAIKVKLEREIGISDDILSQLIGSAVEKYSGVPATEYIEPGMEYYPPPSTFMMSTDFYERMQRPVAQISSKDPRLNRGSRPAFAQQNSQMGPKFDEVPPAPLIPRLTPAVALPPPSQPTKNSKYGDEYSDEDDSSTGSDSLDDDADTNRSGSSKHDKKFVMVEMSKLEEIIGKQIAKFLSTNQAATKAASKAQTSARGSKSKKDSAGSLAATPASESSPPDTAKSKKACKNALSKDGSGPMHMTAEEIVSDIKKSMASLCKPKSPVREKPRKTKSRNRIANRIESSSESDAETPARTSTSLSPKTKSPNIEPSALRNKITNDVAGIIKLGKTPKSAKTKPTPALKLAEQIGDVNLLTPLREMPYDDKRKKKPETGGTKKQKRIPKNTDMSMHCNSGEKSCLLCKDMEKDEELISHYVNVHRENEVFVARLELGQVETLRQNPNLVKPVVKSNIEKYSGKCPFCLEEMTCPIGRFMEHFASHTGEFAYECDCCGTRDSRKRDLLQHCNTACEKGAKFIYVYRYDLSSKVIQAYVCGQCNYTQLNSANVIKHIRTEHDQQQVSTLDYIPVTLFEIDTTEKHEEDKAARVAHDKIEVNNEAIAEEDDDYDTYDNFEYAPSPERDTPRDAPPPGEAIEYVKNELIMDAIDAIDWKSIEDTLAEPDNSPKRAQGEASTIQQPTISLNDSLHILPKNEALEQSVCSSKSLDLGTQIFTEIHAMASESPLVISSINSGPEVETGVSSPACETSVASPSVKNSNVASVENNTKPCVDSPNDASTAKKVTKFKPFDSSNKNITRVQSIGIEKTAPYRFKFHCFVLDCYFGTADSLEDLRKHMRKHQHRWTGQCVACRKKAAAKSLPMDREFLHLINEHLPQKSFAAKLLRPWIENDSTECYKSKDVCEMMLNEFHLENLYKCMGPNCVFTTNSSKDMQFHVTLNHSDDVSALYCCYCLENFIHSNGLIDHVGKNHGASKYQCSKCFYRSCAAYNVQMHQRTFHKDEKSLKIIVCNGQTHTFSTEILEILDHRLKNVKPLACPFFSACRKMIFVKHLLLDHIVKDHSRREPTDINSALYDCIYCSFGTTDLLSIRQHMANEHPSRLLYVCGLVFIKLLHPLASQNNVDITSIKTTSLVYIGDLVNKKKFTNKSSITTNFEANSIDAVNHGCDATALNERIRQMFGEAAISFNDVESYVRKIADGMQPDTMKVEERSELDQLVSAAIKDTGFVGRELYKCGFPKCENAFDNFTQFDRHISSHCEDKKELIYRCPHCNQIIPMNQIRMHTIQHRRHRYLCIFCGESSASQNLAINHLKLGHQSQSNVFEYLTSDKDWNLKCSEQEGRIFVAMPRKHDGDTIEKIVEILRKRFGPNDAVNGAEEVPPERPESPVERKEETTIPVFVSLDNRLCCNIDICPFVAKTDEELMQHISERHLIIMSGKYSCAHCPYNMSGGQLKISRMGNHLRYHGPTILVCNVCNYYHYNRLRVLNHISMCHPYNFVTMTLHARSTNGTKMKLEILYNKQIRSPEDNYKCTLCSAILTECEDFFIHMKEHHQLNVRFKCDMCPFFDNTQQAVEDHLKKTHADEEKPRIRSVFLPAGGKWVQNLSPFELLFEYSENVQQDPSSLDAKNVIPPPDASIASEPPDQQSNSNQSPVADETVIKTEDSRKRKSDEPEKYRPGPASKKIRKSGVKRANSSSEAPEETSKRVKISTSPDRATAETADGNTSENLSHMELLATLEADYPGNVTVSNATGNSAGQSSKGGTVESESKLLSKNKSIEKIAKPVGDSIPENGHEKPKETPEPRLKLVPFEKLMAVRPQEQAPETSANISPSVESLQPASHNLDVSVPSQNLETTARVCKVESPMTMFSSPLGSTTAPVSTRVSPRRMRTEVFIVCYQCGTKSDSFTKLRTHYRSNHPGDVVYFRAAKKLLCAYCYTVAPFNEMKTHHFNAHANDLFITREATNHKKCAECGFESGDIQVLKNHVETQHSNLYVQLHSSFEFMTQTYLEDLLKIGTGQVADVIRCLGCDHIYLQETACKNHVAKAHPNTTSAVPVRVAIKRLLYGCNQCSVFFETEMRAIQHIRKHIDPYGCNFCEMSFPTHGALEDHYRLFHKSNEQSYQFRNVSHNFKKFLEMQLRFSNGLVCGKFELEHTDYGQHDQFLQRIEVMEKNELRNWISRQERTEQIDTIARIKIEIEKEADMFVQSKISDGPS